MCRHQFATWVHGPRLMALAVLCLSILSACSANTTTTAGAPTQAPPAETVLAQSAAPGNLATAQPSMPAATTATTTDLTGNWSGTWKRDVLGGGGTLTLALQQQGANLSGTVNLQGSVCLTSPGTLSGSFSGSHLAFSVTGNNVEVDFTGTLAENALTGTLSSRCSAGSGTGTWQASKH